MADGKENVVIASGDCSVTLLPRYGGKVASLRVGAQELLHEPLHPYADPDTAMPFQAGDAGGWDECLPSVAPCSIAAAESLVQIPDHGDLWRIPWQLVDHSPDSVALRARSFSLPLEFTRTLLIAESTNSSKLHLLYSLANLGTSPVPWSWAAHPLFRCAPGDRLILPQEIHSLRLEGSRYDRLGRHGDSVSWPLASLPAAPPGSPSFWDLSTAAPAHAGIGDKLFAGPMREGWCILDRPSVRLRITTRFDPLLTPYLGLWLCYGGWPEGDGPKQYCIAPEPSTAPVDSLAEEGSWTRKLEPGDTATWPLEFEIEPRQTEATFVRT